MGSKRKFKRDYIILESKDANFRNKERVLPKAFAKVEVNDDKSVVALYVENLKYMKEGYKVVAIRSDYETIDLGKIVLSEQGKGEFVLDLGEEDYEIKAIALLYERTVPLIGFKGNKIENYEEILFMDDETIEEYEIYEEVEYVETDEDDEDFEGEDDFTEEAQEENIDVYPDDFEDTEEELYIESDEEIYAQEDEDIEEDIDIEEDEEEKFEDMDEEMLEEDLDDDYEEINEYSEMDNYKNIEENSQLPRKIKTNDKKHKKVHSKSKYENTPIKNSHIQKRKVSKHISQNQQPTSTNHHKTTNIQKQAGSLLMPRQIKKGLKYFKEVKPFVNDYIEDTRWWKIEINPTTLCGCVMPYLGYVNALNYTMYSDSVMNSYKYRHYLFGVQYDEYNKRKNYIYAVPGNGKDQPDNGSTGFNVFQPCDNRNNSLGYWLCFVDSRYRRIVK